MACGEEYPHLKSADDRYRERGLRIISISQDPSKGVAGMLAQEVNATFPVVHDADGEIFKLYGIKSIPTNVAVTREGRIVHVAEGFSESSLEAAAKAALGEG
ncbi:MAG: TlpA family protein disulfide reductase [Armatimonadetes bacterium]|nr:TlpA family protein disulfide reductase [Armatimonadota bacterium]